MISGSRKRIVIWRLFAFTNAVVVIAMLLFFKAVTKDLLALIPVLAGHLIFRQYILNLPIPLRGQTIDVDNTVGRIFALIVGVFAWSIGIYGLYLFGR